MKKAIHIRLHPNNISRNRGIEILEAWISTIKQHNTRSIRTYEGTKSKSGIVMRIGMHQYQQTNVLQIATRKQSTSLPDEG